MLEVVIFSVNAVAILVGTCQGGALVCFFRLVPEAKFVVGVFCGLLPVDERHLDVDLHPKSGLRTVTIGDEFNVSSLLRNSVKMDASDCIVSTFGKIRSGSICNEFNSLSCSDSDLVEAIVELDSVASLVRPEMVLDDLLLAELSKHSLSLLPCAFNLSRVAFYILSETVNDLILLFIFCFELCSEPIDLIGQLLDRLIEFCL